MLIRKGPGLWVQEQGTHFIVVDLDVFSRRRLTALAKALEGAAVRNATVSVLYEGPQDRRRYSARFEINRWPEAGVDWQIQTLIALIKKLPKQARVLWEGAQSKEFNIGIEAGLEPRSREFKLSPRTVARVAEVDATIAITVYAPEAPARHTRARKAKRRRRSG